MSWPHFLHGENILLNGVHGLAPNPENHSFILDVDPVSIRITFYEHILTPDFPNVSSVLSPIKRNGFLEAHLSMIFFRSVDLDYMHENILNTLS